MNDEVGTPVIDWGCRLSDAVREALVAGRLEDAQKLARDGDGQTRSLAKEYAYMFRGLGTTIRVLLPLLQSTLRRDDEPARAQLVAVLRRFHTEMRAAMAEAYDTAASIATPAATHSVEAEIAEVERVLGEGESRFNREQTQLADAIVQAISSGDVPRAQALIDVKERRQYVPLHDRLVRFMADAFGWVYARYGADELMRFHLATADGQRRGFEKWDQLDAHQFAHITAFLLKQHMGRVAVSEDDDKFTIEQTPCGSGGRLRLSGAYDGADALPIVDEVGPLTLGQPSLPVYCTHCPVWNTVATIQWFGRPHWVFENASRMNGSCTLHIYKRRDGAPTEYINRLTASLA